MHDAELQPLDWLRAVVSEQCTLDPSESFVMLALVRHCDNGSRLAWPSVKTLAKETRIGRTKISEAINELEARGCLSRLLLSQVDPSQVPELYLRIAEERRPNLFGIALLPPVDGLTGPRRVVREADAVKHGEFTVSPSGPVRHADGSSPPAGHHPVRHADGRGSPAGHKLLTDLPNGTAQLTAQAPKPGSPTKGTRTKLAEALIPPDWRPTEAHREFAAKHTLDLELEVVGFLGHYDQQKVASPNGRFTTWLANQAKWNRGKSNQGRRSGFNPQRGVADPKMLTGGNGDWLLGGGK